MKTQMRVRGNKIGDADRIGASEAKAEYLDTVRKGINEIDSKRVEAKAAPAAAPKAAPKDTTAAPTLDEFQAEYERIEGEEI